MKKISYVILVLVLSGTLLTAQTKFGLGINGSYLSPTGDFGDVYKSGFGGSGSLSFDATSNLQLSVSVGYSQFSFNNDKFNQLLSDFFSAFGPTTNVDIQSKLNVVPIMLGAKYFVVNTGFKPYALVELGLHFISADAASIKVNGQLMDAVAGQSKTATAYALGVGFIYKIAPKINLDVNGKLNGNNLEVGTNMSASSSGSLVSTSSKSTVAFFSVGVGLHIEL